MSDITLEQHLDDSLKDLGYEVVRVKLFGKEKKTLQIMIDRMDQENITINDCQKASNFISNMLDLDAFISSDYDLELSSCGIDRPLTKLQHFERFKGMLILLSLKKDEEQRRKFKGRIIDVQQNNIILEDYEGLEITIDFNNIETANISFDNFEHLRNKNSDIQQSKRNKNGDN